MAKEKNECHVCGEETSDWYVVKTNKGNLYRCAECYELMYMRQQRYDYANYRSDITYFKD
jgi:ribosome-binding protein aMBF1 (putative translation factor)